MDLTTILLVGFALHNGTEGIAITGSIMGTPIRIREELQMGFMAGFPTVLGSVLGSIKYSNLLGALFFSVTAGALLYVVLEILSRARSSKTAFAGILIGILLMYFTDLLLVFDRVNCPNSQSFPQGTAMRDMSMKCYGEVKSKGRNRL